MAIIRSVVTIGTICTLRSQSIGPAILEIEKVSNLLRCTIATNTTSTFPLLLSTLKSEPYRGFLFFLPAFRENFIAYNRPPMKGFTMSIILVLALTALLVIIARNIYA